MAERGIERVFPRLLGADWEITSPKSPSYNCIAWAAGEDDRFWWPDRLELYYWPDDAPRSETVAAFIEAYETLGYMMCQASEPESDFERVAIYAQGNRPTHAARQLPNGRWTSKLGKWEDIEHELEWLEGADYGFVVAVLRRPRRQPATR